MNNPDWAAIKAADATYSAMIAAWLAAVGTVLTAGVAAAAGFYAKKAYKESRTQARAAVESVGWSRKAAEAAENQIKVLNDQLEFSEPRPVIILKVVYGGSGRSLQFENVGEFIAVDLRVSEIIFRVDGERVILRFLSEMIVKPGKERAVSYIESPQKAPLANGLTFENVFDALHPGLVVGGNDVLDDEGRKAVRPIKITYRNVRGKTFEDEFVLGLRDQKFACWPSRPLFSKAVSQR